MFPPSSSSSSPHLHPVPNVPTYRQQPTLNNVRIRTAQDALQVFYGVARNTLTLLSRRLDTDERRQIRPGNVYVWEDRSATTSETAGLNMERWCVHAVLSSAA